MAIFKKPAIKAEGGKKKEIPRGLFQKCPGCSEVVPEIELAQNQRVCPRCDYHFAQPAKERIQNLLDPDSFVEMDAGLKSVDVLRFQGMVSYKDRLKSYQERTGLLDAVISGHGVLDGHKVAIAVMDFGFLAATMGSVVGERITRTIEYGTAERCAVIIVAASGGARMYEGMLSLMQMAKTSGSQASLSFGPDKSDDRRRHGKLCIAGRCNYRRTKKHDRFRGSSCYQGNHASGPTREISDC